MRKQSTPAAGARPAIHMDVIRCLAVAGALALATSSCGGKKDDTNTGSRTAATTATASGAAASGSAAATDGKARIAHEMRSGDACTTPPLSSRGKALVGLKDVVWPNGSTLNVHFTDGKPEYIEAIAQAANEWTQYANIHFAWFKDPASPPPEVHVRVSFTCDGQKGFYTRGIGTLSLELAKKGEHTLCFEAFAGEYEDAKYRDHALASAKHEFGHLLGLKHEQQNPNLTKNIHWDEDYIHDWCKKTQDWDTEHCDHQMITPITQLMKGSWMVSKFDKDSIMFYGIEDPNFTRERIVYPQPLTISEMDKKGIAEMYPGREPGTAPPSNGSPEPPPEAPPQAEASALALSVATQKIGSAEGMDIYKGALVLAGTEAANIKQALYDLPPDIGGRQPGQAEMAGHPVAGPFGVPGGTTSFKVSVTVELNDGRTFSVKDMEITLGEVSPGPAADVLKNVPDPE